MQVLWPVTLFGGQSRAQLVSRLDQPSASKLSFVLLILIFSDNLPSLKMNTDILTWFRVDFLGDRCFVLFLRMDFESGSMAMVKGKQINITKFTQFERHWASSRCRRHYSWAPQYHPQFVRPMNYLQIITFSLVVQKTASSRWDVMRIWRRMLQGRL